MSTDSTLEQLRAAAAAGDADAVDRIARELIAGDPEVASGAALNVLESSPNPDLEIRMRLLVHMRAGLAAAGDDEANLPRRVALAWLATWQALDAALDRAASEAGSVQLGLAPPEGTAYSSGTDPGQIADPEARATYEAAIEANRAKIETAALAQRLRPGADAFRAAGEALLSGADGPPPIPAAELRELLAEHVGDEQARARILAAV